MAAIMHNIQKAELQNTDVLPQKQERFMKMEINFVLGKNGGHEPSGLARW